MTNADALRVLLRDDDPGLLCEWEPKKDRPARLSDRYHGQAVLEAGDGSPVVAVEGWRHLRLCSRCRFLKRLQPMVERMAVELPEGGTVS